MIVNCKECNNEVSDKAVSCPNCGYVINKPPPPPQGCFLKTLNVGCLIFFILFGGTALYWIIIFIIKDFIK